MTKRRFAPIIAGLAVLGVLMPAQASLIDGGSYTTDTVTGFDWLDLTQTTGLAFDSVIEMMAPGESLAGWRYASRSEVATFWENAGGVGPFTGAAKGGLDWVGGLQRLWGITYPFVYSSADGAASFETSVAMTADQSPTCAACNLTVYIANNWLISDSSIRDLAEVEQRNEAYRWQGQRPIGHALVRVSGVPGEELPEPDTSILIGAALGISLVLRLRRRLFGS